MNDLYLIRIVTHLQMVLYIDQNGYIWFPDMIDADDKPAYYTDLNKAKNHAKMYGGQVVKCVTAFELVEEA